MRRSWLVGTEGVGGKERSREETTARRGDCGVVQLSIGSIRAIIPFGRSTSGVACVSAVGSCHRTMDTCACPPTMPMRHGSDDDLHTGHSHSTHSDLSVKSNSVLRATESQTQSE